MTSVSALSSGLTPGSGSSLSSALNGTSSSSSSTGSDLSSILSGGASANDAIADSTSTALQQISDAINAISAKATDDVQEFEKTTQDVLYDNNATGRSIGQLRLNTTRLNVISALSPKDTADVFTFNASNSG